MKRKISTLLHILLFSMLFAGAANVFGQCEPYECPDPENNGQICPDSMPIAYKDELYSEVATIVVPLTDTTGVPLHHFTLVAIDSLPPGITWESNAPDNEFMAGNDYCILIEGTPTVADTFYLKIVLDIYINFLGQPVYVTTIVDSTSLFMVVVDNTGIDEEMATIDIEGNYPNPFSDWTSIRFDSKQTGAVTFEVYNLMGKRVHEQRVPARFGENVFLYDGSGLSPGTYMYVIRSGNSTSSKMMVRIR